MTLSQLINACGDSFNSLDHVRKDGHPIASLTGNDETLIFKASCWERSFLGKTPEEAMGKLLNHLTKR